MHELSITQHILDYSLEEANRLHANRIREIHLLLGPFSGIVPDCIQMYMELLAEGTPAEGVRITSSQLPLKIRCRDCLEEGEINRQKIECPHCGSLRLQILSGNDFMIDSLEVDIDESTSITPDHGME